MRLILCFPACYRGFCHRLKNCTSAFFGFSFVVIVSCLICSSSSILFYEFYIHIVLVCMKPIDRLTVCCMLTSLHTVRKHLRSYDVMLCLLKADASATAVSKHWSCQLPTTHLIGIHASLFLFQSAASAQTPSSQENLRVRPSRDLTSRIGHEVSRVRGAQQKWVGQVEEQRKNIFDRHTMLN